LKTHENHEQLLCQQEQTLGKVIGDQSRFSIRSIAPHRIAVDLTQILPTGGNGGAKILALELIRQFGVLAPTWEFVLLTAEQTHEELVSLDSTNIRRLCVSKPASDLPFSNNLANYARQGLSNVLSASSLESIGKIYRHISSTIFGANSSLLQRLGADLLFCPFTASQFVDTSVPLVSLVHDLQHVYYPQFFEAAVAASMEERFRLVSRTAVRMITVSEYVRKTILEKADLAPDRVTTIHSCMQHRLSKPSPDLERSVLMALHLKPNRYLLYPANFWPNKNHETLLAGFHTYRRLAPQDDLKLVLTGAGSKRRDSLVAASVDMGFGDSIVFPGFLPDPEFAALMYNCSALIFPSLFEGFGMPLLEAMAVGRPVLSSKVTSLPEVAGDAALFFDPTRPDEITAAIARIERDDDLRRSLIAKGQQRSAEFGASVAMAERYLNVFQEVLDAQQS